MWELDVAATMCATLAVAERRDSCITQHTQAC
jgi:hypothetical protein